LSTGGAPTTGLEMSTGNQQNIWELSLFFMIQF